MDQHGGSQRRPSAEAGNHSLCRQKMTPLLKVSLDRLTTKAPITLRLKQLKQIVLISFFGPKPLIKFQKTQIFVAIHLSHLANYF